MHSYGLGHGVVAISAFAKLYTSTSANESILAGVQYIFLLKILPRLRPLSNDVGKRWCADVVSQTLYIATWFCYQLIAKPGNKTATAPMAQPVFLYKNHHKRFKIKNSSTHASSSVSSSVSGPSMSVVDLDLSPTPVTHSSLDLVRMRLRKNRFIFLKGPMNLRFCFTWRSERRKTMSNFKVNWHTKHLYIT